MPSTRHIPDVDGRLIRLHRMLAGQTATAVAQRVGISRSEFSRWETGQRQPGPVVLLRLAAALDVPWSDLLDNPNDAPKAITLLGEPTGGISSCSFGQRLRAKAAL
jgi:transcriptional regulator with XRE-family HTH domain